MSGGPVSLSGIGVTIGLSPSLPGHVTHASARPPPVMVARCDEGYEEVRGGVVWIHGVSCVVCGVWWVVGVAVGGWAVGRAIR